MTAATRVELNRYFEIIGLLYNCSHPNFMTDETIEKAATEYGIPIDELKKKVIVVLRKYLTAFQKEMVKENDDDFDFFFSDDDDDFVLSIQVVCANHPEWFENNIEDVTEKEIVLAFVREVLDDQSDAFTDSLTLDEIIASLNRTGFSSNTCWKLMLIFQSPKEKIKKLFNMISNNMSAYEKAIAATSKPLEKLLEKFPDGEYLSHSLYQDSNLTPTLIYPTVELINTNGVCSNSYIGLFTNDIYKMQERAKATQKNIQPILKALSDNSKFDILLSLKKSPKYNLELAEELHLSAATISHHMNVLLTCRLVNVEKKDGRVYYTLATQMFDSLLSELQNKFIS